MANIIPLALAGIMTVSLSACSNGAGPKETIGTVLGGAAGAWAGSTIGKGSGRVVATAVGTLAGAVIGNEIGKALDDNDRRKSRQTAQRALESGRSYEPTSWSNPDNGHSGEVTPEPAYRDSYGQTCREYTQTIYIDGKRETGRGTACRQEDGSWRIISA